MDINNEIKEAAEQNKVLLTAFNRFNINYTEPDLKFSYTPFKSLLQKGPQCGLIALAMYCGLNEGEIQHLFQFALKKEFTYQGEMFSADEMCKLTQFYVNKKVVVYSGELCNSYIINFLLNKGVMLVPYDSDANHAPCLKKGHSAHWALISGIVENSNNEICVIAQQGKSKHLGIWTLQEISDSNAQLREFDPKRRCEDYKLGEHGADGLCGKSVLIYDCGEPEGRYNMREFELK